MQGIWICCPIVLVLCCSYCWRLHDSSLSMTRKGMLEKNVVGAALPWKGLMVGIEIGRNWHELPPRIDRNGGEKVMNVWVMASQLLCHCLRCMDGKEWIVDGLATSILGHPHSGHLWVIGHPHAANRLSTSVDSIFSVMAISPFSHTLKTRQNFLSGTLRSCQKHFLVQ